MMLGEFGRTPKINKARRPRSLGVVLLRPLRRRRRARRAGHRQVRQDGAYPATTPYSPDDIGATVYSVLGIDPHAEVRDRLGRPVQLNRGRVITPLFDANSD